MKLLLKALPLLEVAYVSNKTFSNKSMERKFNKKGKKSNS